jgi:hypothetical protein
MAQDILGYFDETTGSVEKIEAMKMQGSADEEESKARDGDVPDPEDMPALIECLPAAIERFFAAIEPLLKAIKHLPAAIENIPEVLKNVPAAAEVA